MVTSIIFSKNRACQLDLLLRSMEQNLPTLFQPESIFLLYHYTNEEFNKGYSKVIDRFLPQIIPISQNDFQKDTFICLKNVEDYVCFFVDDNIIYRQCNLKCSLLNDLWKDVPNLTCFSLRLGMNTILQDQYNNIATVFPETIYQWNDILLWNWTTVKVFGDFGYPFSVDGHIYKVSDLLPLLNYEFDTPNAFEGRFDKHKFSTNMMACFEQSVLVNTPLNIVGSSNNNAGRWYGHTLKELNEKFLDNYQISLNNIMETKVCAAHQEMEIIFEKI